ncbi:hypothetical protein NXW09_29385 [Bacteroides ovatus]|nr:hypothetical protein [Bacteroides ovatus]
MLERFPAEVFSRNVSFWALAAPISEVGRCSRCTRQGNRPVTAGCRISSSLREKNAARGDIGPCRLPSPPRRETNVCPSQDFSVVLRAARTAFHNHRRDLTVRRYMSGV